MACKFAAASHTMHVDIRCKYVNECVEDDVLKVAFTKSAENDGNILTKNLSEDLHERHSKKMFGKMPELFPRILKTSKIKGRVL